MFILKLYYYNNIIKNMNNMMNNSTYAYNVRLIAHIIKNMNSTQSQLISTQAQLNSAHIQLISTQTQLISTQSQFKSKACLESPIFTGTVRGIDKSMVGLSNINNTSDDAKPISVLTQIALNTKANLNSPTFIGIPLAPTPITNTNQKQIVTVGYINQHIPINNSIWINYKDFEMNSDPNIDLFCDKINNSKYEFLNLKKTQNNSITRTRFIPRSNWTNSNYKISIYYIIPTIADQSNSKQTNIVLLFGLQPFDVSNLVLNNNNQSNISLIKLIVNIEPPITDQIIPLQKYIFTTSCDLTNIDFCEILLGRTNDLYPYNILILGLKIEKL
jgi:hypothetical protein